VYQHRVGGIRARKNGLISALKAFLLLRKISVEEASTFELMYRRCRTEEEQDEVTKALHHVMDGWKDPGKGAAGGAFSHLRRLRAGIDLYSEGEPEEEDSPALKAAIALARQPF
jgi:hypothetical protein